MHQNNTISTKKLKTFYGRGT